MSKLKVLIVVDVQNCFITGGSLGGDLANLDMMNEIADMVNNNGYNVIVFTRDSHPMGHKSFGIFPNHCRDTGKASCVDDSVSEKPNYQTTIGDAIKRLNIKVELSDDIKEKIIKGPELSYLYYAVPSLRNKVFDPNYEIHIDEKKNTKKHPANDKRIIEEKKQIDDNEQIIVHLQKGEYCEYDAYSAFNYHVKYNDSKPEEIATDYRNSTGLIEFLLMDKIIDYKSEIEIDVCGLVGNICVINTVLQGCALFNQIKDLNKNTSNVMCKYEMCSLSKINQIKNVTFNYHYIKGTRFLPNIKDIKNAQMTEQDEKIINDFITNEIKELNKINKDNQIAKEFKSSNGIITLKPINNKLKGGSNNYDQSLYFYKYMKYKNKYHNTKNLNH